MSHWVDAPGKPAFYSEGGWMVLNLGARGGWGGKISGVKGGETVIRM